MDDPSRTKVRWYAYRWRIALLLPMLLFALLAANTFREFSAHPVMSVAFGLLFLAFAILFARHLWRERHR